MDLSAALTVLDLVLMFVWNCLCMTPEKQKLPIYGKVFPSQDILEVLFAACSLAFAPGLFEVLQASEAPSVAYFKSLPTNCKKQWLSTYSCLRNLAIDQRSTSAPALMPKVVPKYVEKSLNDGYTLVHKGILCWTPIPSAALVPILRTLIVTLEATFTFVFWAMLARQTTDSAWSNYVHGLASRSNTMACALIAPCLKLLLATILFLLKNWKFKQPK